MVDYAVLLLLLLFTKCIQQAKQRHILLTTEQQSEQCIHQEPELSFNSPTKTSVNETIAKQLDLCFVI